MQVSGILRAFSAIFIDALFPLSPIDKELASLTPQTIFSKLQPAPAYDQTVLELGETKSIFAYKDERVSKLVWGIKYKKNKHNADLGGHALCETLINMFGDIPGYVLVVPMPITPRRRRERGYNQCELLTDAIDQISDKFTLENRFMIRNDILVRTVHKSKQALKNRTERLENSGAIFALNEHLLIQVKKETPIVIIDDVITTGSTMQQALGAFYKAGYQNVRGLSLAH